MQFKSADHGSPHNPVAPLPMLHRYTSLIASNQIAAVYRSFLLALLFCFTAPAVAQVVNGIILDESEQPVIGAYVFFHKADLHAHTDVFGGFVLDGVTTGDTLVITHIGFEGKTIVVGAQTRDLQIVLNEQVIELVGTTVTPQLDAINLFTAIDLRTAPVNSAQDVLRKVPGLIIGQHAGGGKAEQLFLRGFDIDHGTDINITVDGMPVNMVSHAHGQGYADLHFLIPETIDKIDFGKGPYNADQGNFATAGYVAFTTKEKLDQNVVELTYGSFNTMRMLSMFNVLENNKSSAYVATDYQLSDGPFDSPQNFSRVNLMGKYTTKVKKNDKLSLQVSNFQSKWDASGQIPVRLVDNGTISRWGAVDDTEGGTTSRTNLKLDYLKSLSDDAHIRSSIFYSAYDFELYSNFTFFLLDSLNGDQIRQKEQRQILGGNTEWSKAVRKGKSDWLFKAGAGFRNDRIQDVELSHTRNRQTTLEYIQRGDIDETNLYGYLHAELSTGRWLINPGVRYDAFNFQYYDRTDTLYQTLSSDKGIASPKLNILFNQTENLQYYLKGGYGFHSNDTRVVVARNGQEILPAAYGSDLGIIWKPFDKLLINTAAWVLMSDQEFVYVGDAGIVEPSGRSRRFGGDLSIRYQVSKPLFIYGDINYSQPRSIDEAEGYDRIALAPELTATGGISLINFKGFSGGTQFRYVGDRPANEDNSIVAKGYFITDFNLEYAVGSFGIGLAVENVFNTEWKETQFATESRLRDEAVSVEEIHFTPGTPFAVRGSITYKF